MTNRQEPFTEEYVIRLLGTVEADLPTEAPREIVLDRGHSNDVAEVRYGDGRVLMIKRARLPEMAARFRTDRAAARLLRERAGLVAPDYLPVAEEQTDTLILVYWRIPLPTLEDLWPGLSERDRADALRGWGALFRRIHGIAFPSHGPLLEADQGNRSLTEFLDADLMGRLRPAVRDSWPAGGPALDRLIDAVPALPAPARQAPAVLVHNDLHAGHLLCQTEDGRVRCVGVIDLEDAFAGPPEADLARTEILHGPLFDRAWSGDWFERILDGYGAPLDPSLLAFFRAYQLINMGYHAALIGLAEHAEAVARAAEQEVAAIGSGRRHRDIVTG